MKTRKELKEFLKIPRRLLITSHVRPDGDAIGSSLALYHFLKKTGHSPMIILPTRFPYYFKWFPGIKEIKIFDKEKSLKYIERAELIFAVDFNCLSRNGELGKILLKTSIPKVLLDHHPEPEDVFDLKFWSINSCAAAEQVFDLIDLLEPEFLVDIEIATCLYAALIFDTSSFKHSSVTSKTHEVVAKLFDSGIDNNSIQQKVFDNFTENRLRFWGYLMQEKLVVMQEYKTAYITISQEEWKKHKVRAGDTENLVNIALWMDNIILGVLIIEREDHVKLSFRSRGNFPANEIAVKHFDGGGHLNAAGGETKLTFGETIEKFKKVLEEYRDLLTGTK